ncbi:hypothetical protein RMATCC62417_01827 [Rhizopus microsporus]|nr:hypothetical protein RMATCC62417_01827 [Rhizopus microsporus]
MEDNKAPEAPSPCTAGCGFYGNKIYNNMCSKCFKELEKNNKVEIPQENKDVINTVQPSQHPTESSAPLSSSSSPSLPLEQKNKGRCFSCRSKIPISKQLTNKCRCELVFCDTHRFPDKHDCQYDHAKKDKDILAKNNPKINERPRGGNSFHRIDSL